MNSGAPTGRGAYHHGTLREALILSGFALARGGGPEAVTLREASRRAGVSHNAIYRHFEDRGALVRAVSSVAQEHMAARLRQRIDNVDCAEPDLRASGRIRELGLAYIEYALDEPGLFQIAFRTSFQFAYPTPPISLFSTAPPFLVLREALDDLVGAGLLPATGRQGAEFACWSGVHGASQLATRGCLSAMPRDELNRLSEELVDGILKGIMSGGAEPPDQREGSDV